MPLWRTHIAPAIFFSIVGILILGLVIAVANIRSKRPAIPVVDTAAEAKVARERLLRNQANGLLRQGRVDDAFSKLDELEKLAPKSPYVAGLLDKLTQLRAQVETSKQQIQLAKQRFDEGMVFFNNKQFSDAVKAFDESFHLNPNSDDAANYLKLAQQEDERVKQEQARAKTAARLTQTTTAAGTKPATTTRGGTQKTQATTQPVAGSAQITTMMNSPVNDGYIMVKVGSDTVAHENLWQETGRFIMRRKVPRDVNVTREITPKTSDVEVWVVIPSLNIQEHHTLPRQSFQPGTSHRLMVNFNLQNKSFSYQMN